MSKFSMKIATSVAIIGGMIATAVSASAALNLPTQNCSYMFNTNMKLGSRGTDVMNLQKVLNAYPQTRVAESGAGSPGMETTYFGAATRAAVNKFHALHLVELGITAPTGNVFAGTRALLNAICSGTGAGTGTPTGLPAGCTSTVGYSPVTGVPCNSTGSTPTTGPVSASLSTTNPASGTVVAGQATANLANFTFTGNGVVTGIQLMRTGVSANNTLTNVYLYEGNTRLTDAASVNSNGTITFSNPSGLMTVNGSRTISVRADILAGTQGQTVGVMLSNYTVAGQTAATVSNLSGNLMTIAAASDLATAVVSANTVGSARTVDAGTSNYTLWSANVQIGQRATWLKSANFRVVGSAETGALQNARLIVDGAQVGAAVASVTANGTLSFDLSSAPVSLNTGSHTIEVRGDVVGGANRNFYLSLQNAGDLMLTDSQYNVNITPFSGTLNTAFSMNSAGVVTINPGTLSLAKDPTFNSTTNVTAGASNVTLAKYTLRSFGEAVKVMQMVVDIDLGTGTEGINNVALYVNGAQVGTSQSTTDQDDTLTYNLGSSLIVPAGQTVTLEVRADAQDETNDAYSGTITTQVTIPVGQAQGQTSFAVYPTGTALTSATTVVTAGAATASVSASSGFLTSTVGANVSNARVGSYVITSGNTEGLRVTNLAVSIDQVLGSATTGDVELTDISNLRATVTVQGQSAIALNAVNPQATNNFSTDFTIPAGQSATVDVYVDVTNATAGETIQTNLLVTARGASSNVVLTSGTGIASAQAGRELTVGSGALTGAAGVTVVSSQATSQRYVIGGSSVEPIVRYSVKPTAGAVTLEELTFTIGGTTNAITALSVTGTTGGSSCSVAVPSGASSVTITGCHIPVAYTLGGTDLIVTPTINSVGLGGINSNGTTATVDLTSIKYNDGTTSTTATLDGIDDADDLANTSASNAIRPVASLPTLTLTAPSNNLTAGQVRVATVTVFASNGGNINLESLPVTVSLSGGATLATTAGTDDIIIMEGNTLIATTEAISTVATPTSQAFVVTFTNDEIVSAGGSRTFDIYVKTVASVSGDDAASTSLTPSSSFVFDDINGGGDNLTGQYILNYPTSSVTVND